MAHDDDAPFTSPLARELAEPLLERFVRYARIDTQSSREGSGSPSTPGQLDLGRILVEELLELGLTDAALDDNGYVTASLAASNGASTAIGLIAHVDTSPDAPASGVEPIVHRAYDGGVIELPNGGTRLDPRWMPELAGRGGHDVVTSSGDTLLGADDKAGVAAIMSALAHLVANPELARAPLRIAFTPDEEIGAGAHLLDLERFGATCAYTIDGSDLGVLQNETFSGVEAVVTITGIDVHPGFATGKLVNAMRLAARFIDALPADTLSPETTEGRDGFIHPYRLEGTPARAQIRMILRDFDDELLAGHAELVERIAHEVVGAEPRASVDVEIREQYRNMRRHVDAVPQAMAAAEQAIRAEGIEPIIEPIRGGTDGSRLSARGLPTPNLFNGGHEYHSVREWASLQDMAASAATIVRLAEAWAAPA
jgi:tripeptide aminopeptidase